MSAARKVNRPRVGDVETAKPPDVGPRYKRTDIGVIPEDWDCSRIGDLTKRVGSGITPTGGSRVYVTAGRPFVRSQNVGWGVLNLHDLAFITDETHELFAASEINEGDVLLNITGASIGRSAVADIAVARGNVNQHVCEIRPDPELLSSQFLNSYLLSAAGQRQIDNSQSGGNRQGLNFSQIRSFLIPRPALREQCAIAEALSDVDGLLAALESLIAKKRAIKQAAMQRLLTGQLRLSGFDGEWQLLSIGQHSHLNARIGWQGLTTAEYLSTGTHHLVTGTDFLSGRVNWSTCPFVSPERYDQDRNIQLQVDDVLLTKDGTIGKVAFVDTLPGLATLNSGVFVIRPKANAYEPKFLFYILTSPVFEEFLAKLQAGSTISHLYQKDYVSFAFLVPPTVEEQRAIAAVLSDMDAEITAVERRRDKTHAVKQGMMQQLLTGRVRLVRPEMAAELTSRP